MDEFVILDNSHISSYNMLILIKTNL